MRRRWQSRRRGSPPTWGTEGLLRLFVFLGLFAALYSAAPRWAAERGPRDVEIILDLPSVLAVAEATGDDLFDVLTALRAVGANVVAVAEITVADAVEAGRVALFSPADVLALPTADLPEWLGTLREEAQQYVEAVEEGGGQALAEPLFLVWDPGEVPPWLNASLREVLSQVASRLAGESDTEVWRIGSAAKDGGLEAPEQVLEVSLGFDRELLAALQAHGFRIAPRPVDAPLLSPDDVRRRMVPLEAYTPLGAVVFVGEQIAGGGGQAHLWADVLRELDAHPASIEFALQRGFSALDEAVETGVVRLHAISAGEMGRLSPDVAIARWLRAVRERGMTALYVRLFTEPPPETLAHGEVPSGEAARSEMQTGEAASGQAGPSGFHGGEGAPSLLTWNVDYVAELVAALEREGFAPGVARPLQLPEVPTWAVLLQYVGIAGAGLLLLRRFILLPRGWEAAMWGAVALGLATLEFGLGEPLRARQAGAFLAAVILPSLAVLRVVRRSRGAGGVADGQGGRGGSPLGALMRATAVSLPGAIWVIGLMAESRFVQGVHLFLGVKAMHVVPPVLVVLGVLWGEPARGWREAWRRGGWLLEQRIAVKHLLALGLLGVLALLMVLRTGNEFLGVSAFEEWLRTTLEEWLRIRPRNKEFLLGHPAMVVLGAVLRGRGVKPGVAALWAGLGSIGQLSLVNTFAHLHTPLEVSLLRTLYGLLLGAAIGYGALGLWRGLSRRLSPEGEVR